MDSSVNFLAIVEQLVKLLRLVHSGLFARACQRLHFQNVAIEGTLNPLFESAGIHKLICKSDFILRVIEIQLTI